MTTTNTTVIKKLEQKAKAGWRCFFMMRDDYCELNEHYGNLLFKNRQLAKEIKDGKEVDITYLKSQFVEMYDMVKKNSECPVCFELLTKENIEVPSCGHLICKNDKATIMLGDKKCPCCRKNYYN